MIGLLEICLGKFFFDVNSYLSVTIDLIKRKYFASCQADGRTVRLKLAYELLDVNPHKFVFSGKRTIRGIPADVWIAEKIPDSPDEPYSTIEIFFADPEYTVQIGKGSLD